MNNPVVWFEIYVNDMPRARAFYEAMLGLTLAQLKTPDSGDELEMWAFPMDMTRPGAGGALAKMAGVEPGGGTLVYFACEDCAVEAARAVAAGGSLLKGKMSIGEYGHIAIVSDTEGNCIGLHSMQ